MLEMTKKQKRHLKELSSKCYEIEVSNALNDFGEDFKKWKNKEITVWELNDKIHEYHDGTARDLYKFYEFLKDPRIAVAQAISKGIIKIEDVQENCRSLLESLIEFYDNG
ncbi:MAG: hypothetical protein PVI90_06120 [Desulfobacteraceae bacterium]|jgi:hypothetical protein